jgi:hypothetical protein
VHLHFIATTNSDVFAEAVDGIPIYVDCGGAATCEDLQYLKIAYGSEACAADGALSKLCKACTLSAAVAWTPLLMDDTGTHA